MVHRHEHLCFTSQLWLPYLAFCFDLTECFQGLHIWSRIMGNKSSKLQYVLQIMTMTCIREGHKKGCGRSSQGAARSVCIRAPEQGEGSKLSNYVGSLVSTSFIKWVPRLARRVGHRHMGILSQSLFLDWGTVPLAPSDLYTYVHEMD